MRRSRFEATPSSAPAVVGLFVVATMAGIVQVRGFQGPGRGLASGSILEQHQRRYTARLSESLFYDDFAGFDNNDDDDDDDDDDDLIDPDTLGDWRAFRRNLALSGEDEKKSTSVSRENEELLKTQCKDLAREYINGVWAHTTPTPEVGGLVARMPLESEIFRNHRHSMTGKTLRKRHVSVTDHAEPAVWYSRAQALVEAQLSHIAEKAGDEGEIDASTLDEASRELLSLYLDYQETWQEICLILERDEESGTATTLVLNRPMAFKLTENLAQLILHGAYSSPKQQPAAHRSAVDMKRFLKAFGSECAVYIGGPDEQDQPAELVHGIADLPGAVEIAPNCGIYAGGLEAAVAGVLAGKYKPVDFRFFVGRHSYDESLLDVNVVLGKYQPIACARSLALKQCISLPKPLWHEVLELCGGEMKEISQLELTKRDDLQFQITDEDSVEEYDTVLLDDEIPDELDELEAFDDDDDEDYYTTS